MITFTNVRNLAVPILAVTLLSVTAAASARAGTKVLDLSPDKPTSKSSSAALRDDNGNLMDIEDKQTLWGDICAKQRGIHSAVVRWRGNPDEVRCIDVRETMATLIVFPTNRVISSVVTGDESSFSVDLVAQRPNTLRIMPKGTVGVDTQMTVITTPVGQEKRGSFAPAPDDIFTFYLRSYGVHTPGLTNLTVFVQDNSSGVKSYDATGAVQSVATTRNVGTAKIDTMTSIGGSVGEQARGDLTKARPGDWLRPVSFDVNKLRFDNYKIMAKDDASVSIAPVRVFDDGVFTYVDFGENGRADRVLQPVAHLVVDGIDSKVNQRFAGPIGNILVVEGIGNITLRNGRRTVCLLYQGSPVSRPANVQVQSAGDIGSSAAQDPATSRPSSSRLKSKKTAPSDYPPGYPPGKASR